MYNIQLHLWPIVFLIAFFVFIIFFRKDQEFILQISKTILWPLVVLIAIFSSNKVFSKPELIANIIGALSWPIVVLIIMFFYYKPITFLLYRISKVKFGSLDVELDVMLIQNLILSQKKEVSDLENNIFSEINEALDNQIRKK